MWSCHILKGKIRQHPSVCFKARRDSCRWRQRVILASLRQEFWLKPKTFASNDVLWNAVSGKSMQVQRLEVMICFEARGACTVRLNPIECTRCCFFVVNHRRLKRLTLNRCCYEGEIIHACTIKPLHSGQWAEGSGLVICLRLTHLVRKNSAVEANRDSNSA